MNNDLNLSEKILSERRKRNMTQEELGVALGVSAQAISNWERGGYPDITMLPGIANYFRITVDELLGNDTVGQKEDIRQFFEQYFFLTRNGDKEQAFRLSLKYARKYPQKYGIATLAADAIANLPEELRAEHLPTLRELCNRVIEEATHQGVRNLAIRIMCSICSDDEAEKWYNMCPTFYNACLCEVKEERFWKKDRREESRLQFDVNNLVIFKHFLFRPNRNDDAPERAAALYESRIHMLESLFEDGEIPDAWIGHYAELKFRLACAQFGCKRKEDGYAALETSFKYAEMWDSIPEDTHLALGNPALFGGIKSVKGKSILIYPDGTVHHEHLERGFHTFDLYDALTKPSGWAWFDSVRKEARFTEYVGRARKYNDQ